LATLRLREVRLSDAAAAIEAALIRLRTDPWPIARFKERVFQLAEILASQDQHLARRMFDALGQPLAVYANEDARLLTRAEMTRRVDFKGLCRDAVDALEPHVPWTERFLRLRRDCYQAAADPRLPVAVRDLDEYLGNLRQPILGK
jgi:spermidine synthase